MYEYKIEVVGPGTDMLKVDYLNSMALDGWELVETRDTKTFFGNPALEYTFKRLLK